MRLVAAVLKPGDDIRTAIESLVAEHQISAGVVLSCVGALSRVKLRMAGTERDIQDVRELKGHFEIVSINGNVGQGRTHLHMSVSDDEGKVVGGHVKTGGNIVEVTCEVVIVVEDSLKFSEQHDSAVGWDNLMIEENT